MGQELTKQFPFSTTGPVNLSDLCKNGKYTATELEEWHEKFTAKYPDNAMTQDQVVEAYAKQFPNGKAAEFADNLFRFFDVNKDGKIDFRELVVALGVASRGTDEEKLKWMFRLYDVNGNGSISRDEMRTVLKSLIRIVLPANAQENVDTVVEERLTKIFQEIDVNGDEAISLQEFLKVGNTSTVFLDVLQTGLSVVPGKIKKFSKIHYAE